MCIDYGTKRVGVALSDEGGAMAFPHTVLENNSKLTEALIALAKREAVGAIVMGHSHTLAGVDNPVAWRADACASTLSAALSVPVHFESEVYSTQEAIREQGRNEMTDASAATIILNSFLIKQKKS